MFLADFAQIRLWNINNVVQANYCIKTSPYFSKGYKFKYHKNTLYGLNIHPPVRVSKNVSGQMVLSRPPWPVFLADFAQIRLWNVNNVLQANYCIKTSPYFSKGYNLKYHENTLYGLNIHLPVRISKSISGQMVLSPRLGLCFSQILPKIRRWKVNNCVTRIVTLE